MKTSNKKKDSKVTQGIIIPITPKGWYSTRAFFTNNILGTDLLSGSNAFFPCAMRWRNFSQVVRISP